nr:ATP-binding cassette domain-containing protein [Dankookia rubra]
MTGAPLLRVSGLTKRYGDQLALAEVGFGLGTGEVVGLIGPNGAGKTTVLECLAGLLPADAGTVHWSGEELPPARRKAALFYLPDGITPDAEQPVSGVLTFFGRAWNLPGTQLAEAVKALALDPVLESRLVRSPRASGAVCCWPSVCSRHSHCSSWMSLSTASTCGRRAR